MTTFRDFFAAIRDGARPYPWQERLAERLAAGSPPAAIRVPTGAGKTATIDALVWALGQQADRAPHERTIGVRTVWAIDRRILVDEVHDHARRIADLLTAAVDDPGNVLHPLALRLMSFTADVADARSAGDATPLVVQRWRGNLRMESFAHHPLQPQIITSTVAQIGSRILFRGYGIGERSLTVEAGLSGVDTTICLDEVHLAGPLRSTLHAIRDHRGKEALPLPPLTVIELSATPGDVDPGSVIDLGADDIAALGARLTGRKTARLVEPDGEDSASRIGCLTAAVDRHLDQGAHTVACVVNTVRTAVAVNERLARRDGIDRMLLIGPQRPADREAALSRHRAALFDGVPPERPLVVIATQTIEVGLDADVEALVTESASATALVQRFGRLNRSGRRAGTATIVRDTSSPLYERDEPAAWRWLGARRDAEGAIDMSVISLIEAPPPQPEPSPQDARAALLTDETLELLVQTSPQPAPMCNPDVAAFIRGAAEEPSADVAIAWRCDLRPEEDGPDGAAYREALLRLAPPTRDEMVPLSVGRARALLAGLAAPRRTPRRIATAAVDGPDIDGADVPVGAETPAGVDPGGLTRFVIRRGSDHLEGVTGTPAAGEVGIRDLRPGDVIVLPASAGGYADGALAPEARDEVPDLGAHEAPPTPAGGAATAARRLTTELLGHLAPAADGAWVRTVLAAAGAAEAEALAGGSTEARAVLLDRLGYGGTIDPASVEVRRVTTARDDLTAELALIGDLGEDDDDAAVAGGVVLPGERGAMTDAWVMLIHPPRDELRPAALAPPTLEEHTAAVVDRLGAYLRVASLDPAVAGALEVAARAHDLGKADPRQQAYFRGGAAAADRPPVAKSVFGTGDLQRHRAAKAASGLPDGFRHEIASVAILADALRAGTVADLPDHIDADLALHLTGTHHGLGLPVPRVPSGGAPARSFRATAAGITGRARADAACAWDDGEWLRRHVRLVDRYGPWGLAYLSALLVLADRTVSQEGR